MGSLDSLLFFLPLQRCFDHLLVTMLIELPLSLSLFDILNWHLDVTSSTNPMGVTRSSSIGRPWTTSRAQQNAIPAMRSSPVQNKGEQTRQVRPHLCGNRVYLVTFRARNAGGHGASTVVLALHQANARLGPAGRRARGQAREGHLCRASPGHDRPSDYTSGSSSLPSTLRWLPPTLATPAARLLGSLSFQTLLLVSQSLQ